MIGGFRAALKRAFQRSRSQTRSRGEEWDIADAMSAYDDTVYDRSDTPKVATDPPPDPERAP